MLQTWSFIKKLKDKGNYIETKRVKYTIYGKIQNLKL